MRRYDFVKATISWVKLCGEAFWVLDDTWLTRGTKNPIVLARPDRMRPVTDMVTGGLLGWRFRDGNGVEQLLLPEQVKHIKSFNPYDDIRGLGDWEAAKIAADSDYAAGVFAKNLAASNGDRGPIVTADGNPTDEQIEQITRQLREKSIMSRRGDMRPIFLAGPNMKVQDPTVQAVDAAFISQRLENRHEIYIAFGVPPSFAEVAVNHSIGSASDYYRLIETTCMPAASQVADAIEEVSQLFLNTSATIFAEFDFSSHSTMQQVRAERFDQAAKGVDRGMPWKVASDYLGLKMPRFEGDEVGRIPFNLKEIGGDGQEARKPRSQEVEEVKIDSLAEMKSLFECKAHAVKAGSLEGGESGSADDDERVIDPERLKIWEMHVKARAPWVKRFESRFKRHLMAARAETLANIEKATVTKGANSVVNKDGVLDLMFDLGAWLQEFLTGMNEVQRNAMTHAGLQLIEHELDIDQPLEQPSVAVQVALIKRENLLANAGTDIWNEVRQGIGEGIENGETMDQIAGRVKNTFNGISSKRARTIAATETSAAYESGRHITMKEAGIEFKEWLTSQDARVRISHWDADGQRQRIDDPYQLSNGISLMYPAVSGGPPEECINCRCVSMAATSL